jgi:hypothetical protein
MDEFSGRPNQAAMTLQEQLDQIRAGAKIRIPEANRTIMRNAADALIQSGRLEKTPKVGDAVPDFKLADTTGTNWDSRTLRDRGPLLVTFFCGHW